MNGKRERVISAINHRATEFVPYNIELTGGLLMSPDVWRTFIKPGVSVMLSEIKSKGNKVALHS